MPAKNIIISDRKVDRDAGRDSGAAGTVRDPPAPGDARACARPPAWWSRPARRARCTTSRCSPATARKPCIRTSRWRRCRCRRQQDCSAGRRRREGDQQLRQGDRQGPDEGDVQDGHLDLHVVLRRADLRGGRPVACAGREVLHGHDVKRRRHRRVRGRRGSDPHAHAGVRRRPGARRTRSMPAANMPGACAAKSTCGRRTRSPSCSMRRAPTATPRTRNTRSSSTTSRSGT